ncbi:MAG: MCE family protein [Chthonomonas sp.]|nr:MCE family protein [Chthonomonas sp.]
MGNAFRVGLFACVFVGMLVGAYAILGRSMFAAKTYPVYAEFADAAGVTSGAQVLYAGVKVGQVESVGLLNGKARLKFAMEEGPQIPGNVEAFLPMSLIGIGDRQIELIAKHPAGTLTRDQVLMGSLRSPLDAFAPDSGKTLEEVNKTLASMRGLMEDKSLKHGLVQVLDQGQQTAKAFGQLASRMDGLIAQNQGLLAATMKNANRAVSNGAEIAGDLRKVSKELASYAQSGKLQGGIDGLLTKMNTTLETGNAMLSDMRALINTPANKEQLNAMIANAKLMTDSGVQIAKNAEVITAKGSTLADEFITISKKASVFADEANDLLRTIKKKVESLPNSIGGIGGGMALSGIETRADLFREFNPNHWRVEVNAKVPMGKRNLHLGLYDALESNKLTAQMGVPLGKSAEARVGMFAGKAGVGVDYNFASGLRLRSDLFDLNKPRLDLKANFGLSKDLTGWVGFERVFQRNSPTIGIGIRK